MKIPFLYVGANGRAIRAYWYGPTDPTPLYHVDDNDEDEVAAWERRWLADVQKLLPSVKDPDNKGTADNGQ